MMTPRIIKDAGTYTPLNVPQPYPALLAGESGLAFAAAETVMLSCEL